MCKEEFSTLTQIDYEELKTLFSSKFINFIFVVRIFIYFPNLLHTEHPLAPKRASV